MFLPEEFKDDTPFTCECGVQGIGKSIFALHIMMAHLDQNITIAIRPEIHFISLMLTTEEVKQNAP